jgi:hypothetical protein
MRRTKTYGFSEGNIYRNGELCGKYDLITGAISEMNEKLTPAQTMLIDFLAKEKLGLVKRKGKHQRHRRREVSQEAPTILKFQAPPEGKPLVEVFAAEKTREIPPAPEQDPRYGDKTPAFIKWMFANHPEEAKKKYGGRVIQGIRMPLVIEKVPELPAIPDVPIGADLAESAMAEEKAEQWVKR